MILVPVKTAELTGHALDWATAFCDNYDEGWLKRHLHLVDNYAYSTDWSLLGNVIQRYGVELRCSEDKVTWWAGTRNDSGAGVGQTPGIAICRCIISITHPDFIDIPGELLCN